jgi:hypothetical protein
MCENMAVSEVCAVSEVLCSVFVGHYTESSNCSVSDEEKGRHTQAMCISYLRRRETRSCNVCLISKDKGDMHTQHVSPFYLTCTKKDCQPNILHGIVPCANTQHVCCHTYAHVCVPIGTCGHGARSTTWSTSCFQCLEPSHCHMFKSWWAWVLVDEVGLNFYTVWAQVEGRCTLTRSVSHLIKGRRVLYNVRLSFT